MYALFCRLLAVPTNRVFSEYTDISSRGDINRAIVLYQNRVYGLCKLFPEETFRKSFCGYYRFSRRPVPCSYPVVSPSSENSRLRSINRYSLRADREDSLLSIGFEGLMR